MTNIFTQKNIIIGAVLFVAISAFYLYANSANKTLKDISEVEVIHPQYVADFSDDRILMGSSHNVFVAKVIEQTGSEPQADSPSTQFSVEIIENLKGDLAGEVTVDQLGGYKDGVLYLVHNDTVGLEDESRNSSLLVPGNTYLLATRYNPEKNQFTLITHENGLKLLSEDANLEKSQLKEITDKDAKVLSLREAYKNEILLEADIQNDNTLNSYKTIEEN